MKRASFLPRRRIVVFLILVTAAGVWIPREVGIRQAERRLAQSRAAANENQQRVASAEEALEGAVRELNAQNAARDRVSAAMAKVRRELEAIDPESRWAMPPVTLPEWNPESPYVWLRKEMMTNLPVNPFSDNGELRSEIAYVLMIDPESQRLLHEKFKRMVSDYRAMEAGVAELTGEHLPGIAKQDGEKRTVRILPSPGEGIRIRQEFGTALRDSLGDQRSALLMQLGEPWMDEQFGTEPKIISVIRHASGSYNVSIRCGYSWQSVGGPAMVVQDHIPAHVRHLFADFWNESPAQ